MNERAAEPGPRRRGSTATREAILEAAAGRFASSGYAGAGVREIAADAGVTAALVNRYFGSKEGLFTEVIEQAFDSGDLLGGLAPSWPAGWPGGWSLAARTPRTSAGFRCSFAPLGDRAPSGRVAAGEPRSHVHATSGASWGP